MQMVSLSYEGMRDGNNNNVAKDNIITVWNRSQLLLASQLNDRCTHVFYLNLV